MPQFRSPVTGADARPLHDSVVRELCAAVMHPSNFYVAEPLRLVCDYRPDEETHWELFHGRALDRTQTRLTKHFASWNVYAVGPEEVLSSEALLAVKYDAAAGQLFVT